MYPVNDIDAQLLLATFIAAKRRPAELSDVIAAAEVLGCRITIARPWVDTLRRATSQGLIVANGSGFELSEAALALCAALPKKAANEERLFLIRQELNAYEPAELSPEAEVSEQAFSQAMQLHTELKSRSGKNQLMPKPLTAPTRRPFGKRPPTGARRRR